jgi:hypothetical protein
MAFFTIEPEVAGALGPRTKMRRETHPPHIDHVHYIFDGWLGDALVESFPVFLIRQSATEQIDAAGLTGVTFDKAEIETSDQFAELHPDRPLPGFLWLRPTGTAGDSDFAVAKDGRLVVSGRALAVLQECGTNNALIEPHPLVS